MTDWINETKNPSLSSVLGAELVTNGGFTGNANSWTLETAWAYNSNNIIFDPEALEGFLAYQSIGAVLGGTYKVSVNVGGTTGQARVYLGGDQDISHDIPAGEGVTTFDLVAEEDGKIYITGIESFDGTIDSVSVKEVLPFSNEVKNTSSFTNETKT